MTKVFVKDDSNPYYDHYTECPVEDTGDEFFTREEVQEATNSIYFSSNMYLYHYAKMKRALVRVAKTVPTNKKSIVLDADLVQAMKDSWEISEYLEDKNWRVNKNRLYIGPPEQKAVRIDDYKCLKSTACHLLSQKGVQLQFIYTSKKDEVVRTLKKLVTWKEIAADLADDDYFKRSGNDIKWMRKLWLDPTLMEGK